MGISKLWLGALAVASAVLLFNSSARADMYQTYDLANGYRTDPIGITANGTVVLYRVGDDLCGLGSVGCYDTYVNGVRVGMSDTNPGFDYDNGASCIPDTAPGIGTIVAAVCNNGREVYGTGRYPPTPNEIYTGPDPVADHFGGGILDDVRLNSSGDFFYLEGNLGTGDGEYFEAIDLTTEQTPEPGSIFLLGTGLFAAAGAMRRRLFQGLSKCSERLFRPNFTSRRKIAVKAINRYCASLCLAIVGLVFILPRPACADTYKIFFLTSDQDYFLYAMDDMGTVVIENPNAFPCDPSACYYSFMNGINTGYSSTSPIPGSMILSGTVVGTCDLGLPAGARVLNETCANGREAFTGYLTADQVYPNVYTGPSASDLLASGGEGLIFMNGRGDIVWDDHFSENWYEAIDLTSAVPEPASFLLLGTGLFSLAGLRRRFFN